MRRVLLLGGDAGLPEEFTVLPIEADERPTVADGLRDEDAVAPDDGSRIAGLRQLHAPFHILGLAPFFGEILLLADAGAERTAPGGPIGGPGGGAECDEGE